MGDTGPRVAHCPVFGLKGYCNIDNIITIFVDVFFCDVNFHDDCRRTNSCVTRLCSRRKPVVGVGKKLSSCRGFAAHGANHSVEKAGDRVFFMMQGAKVKVGVDVDALGDQIAEVAAHIDGDSRI